MDKTNKMPGLKIKASGLVEATIALTIISICLGIALVSISGIIRAQNIKLKTEAAINVNNEFSASLLINNFKNKTIEYPGYNIQKQCETKSGGLMLMVIEAYDKNNRILVSRKRLVLMPGNLLKDTSDIE